MFDFYGLVLLMACDDPAAIVTAKDETSVSEVLQSHLAARPGPVVVLTERMAHDLLSNGIVPSCLACHKATGCGWNWRFHFR